MTLENPVGGRFLCWCLRWASLSLASPLLIRLPDLTRTETLRSKSSARSGQTGLAPPKASVPHAACG